ncbi:hypothetical protein ACCO45_001470 [Purpureocillium lilacinum]|uniref:Uncharacterized protein n=1 Tax=Purpureocillium lilacinum TaxID=33203 RepID=A0ACC4E9Y1_PURLI
MLHQRHNAAGSGSSLQAPSTTITGRSRFSKALPSVPLNLPLRDFAAPRPLPKDLPDLPPAPPPPPSDTNEHRDDDDARSIKTIKSTKSVIARKPAAARVLRSPTASNTSPGTPSSSLSSHTTSPPATAMAIPRRPVGSGGPGAGTKKVTPKASTSSISTTRTSARTTSNASASTVTVARTSTSTTNTTAGTTSSNANGYTNGNGNNASGGGNGNGHGNSSSGLHPTAASPLDPAQPSPTDSISSLLSAYSREPELLQPPAGSNTTANANGGPHESKVPGAWPAAVPTSPPGSGFQFPAPPGRAGMSAAAETPVTGPSAAAAAAATSSSSSNKSKSDRAQANGIGAAVQVGGAAGSGTDASIVKQPASIGHGSGNSTSSGTNRGNGSGSTSTGTSTSTSTNGAPGSTGLAAAGGSVATAARQHSPPARPSPSSASSAVQGRKSIAATPTTVAQRLSFFFCRRCYHSQLGGIQATAAGVSEASRELPGLKLDHSHGSTAATAPLPQPPPAVVTSSAGSGPGEQPKSSQDTIRAVTSPSSSPSRVSPPRPSAVIGLPGRNVRPAAKLHKQQTQDTQQTQHHDQVAASQAMGNGESKLNRIKGSLQKQQHRLRKPSSSSPDKDAANGASKRDQNGPRLAALRPPTPEYHKEDVKSAPAATDTFVSPASPASSSPSPVSLPADSTKALPPQLPTQSARTGLTPSAPSIHGTASLQELNSSAQSPAGSRRASPATDGASSRTRESAESTKFPPRTSSTKQNWQKSVEPLRRSAGDGDPRIVLSDTQGPLYRGRDGTLYPEMKITREFDPKVAYFPTQKAKPLEPGAVIPARPLQESHFGCYQSHRSMNRRSNRHYPLTCQTCDKADSEDRWVCTFCHLRICESCLRALNGHQRVLRRLVDELATNTPLSLSSMSRPGSALGIQAAT